MQERRRFNPIDGAVLFCDTRCAGAHASFIEENPMARKSKTPAPAGETKAQKFARLGQVRMVNVEKAIDKLGKMASRSYEATPAQVDAIFTFLTTKLKDCRNRFGTTGGGGSAAPSLADVKPAE